STTEPIQRLVSSTKAVDIDFCSSLAQVAIEETIAGTLRSMRRPVRGGDYGSACRKRHQDPRGARLEARACAALHGLVMFAEAACLPQPERHPVGVASC